MAIDWEKVNAKVEQQRKKLDSEYRKITLPKKEQPKRILPKLTTTVSNSKGVTTAIQHDRRRYSDTLTQGYKQQIEPQNTESYFTKILKQAKQNVSDTRKDLFSGNAFNKERLQERAKGYTSFQEDMIKNTTAGKVGFGVMRGALPYNTDKVEEKIYSADTRKTLDESKATKAGEIGGLVTQFTAPYMVGSKVIGKALTNVPKVAKMGKFGQTATKSVATDLAVGLPLNVNYAFNKEDLRGSEAAKSIAINTGIDLVAGGVIEAIGGVILKSGKKVATKAEFDALPAPEKEEVIKMLPAPAQETRKAPSRDITAAMVKNTKPAKSTAQGSKTTVQPQSVTKGVKRKDLGADTLKQSDTATNLKRKGALPKGEIPARDVDIPANTPYGDTQRFARTLAEAKIVDDTLLKDIQDAVSKGDFAKFTKSNKTVVDDANKMIAEEGFDSAYNMFKSVMKMDKQAKSSDIALGARLLQDAQKAGDYEKALDISIDLSQMLSETGRTLQAATIAKRLSPEGRLLLVQRTAKKVSDKYGVKVEVSDDIVEKISEAKTEKEIVEANAEATKEIWNKVPATWMDKVNAWRYMSMLTNPKTHLRNIFGNALFVPAREFKNIIGAGLEKKFVKEGERTKAILNPKTDADLIKFARSDFKNVKAILKSQGKLNDTVRSLDSKIFGKKVLEKARELNMNALDAEDTWFMKFAYDGSLAQYMKANKLKPADMVGETLDKARKYAMNEAWRATYRDINAFSNLVSKGKHYLAHNTSGTTAQVAGRRIGGMAIEAVLPFAKTPVNILRRGVIDYSPIGIVNGMIKMSKDVKAGKVTAAEAIDNIASGLSGTGIMALGVFLGYRGIVTGEESDWRTKEGKYTDIQGTQNYALNLEDGSYTLDWAAPLSLPFFVGVEIAKGFRDEGFELSKILDSMTAISDPLFNMTMLQGMNQIISTNMEGASDAIFKTATGYASQYVPTVLGQVARTVDGTRRDTRSTAETNLERQVEKFVNKQITKIPGVSLVFPEYVDLWGRTQDSGGAIQQFLNPGYYKDKNITPVDKEINRLVKNLGNDAKDAIPSDSSYTIKRDGRQYRMSEKELAQFKKTRGQAAYNNIQALIKTVNYQRMTDEDKVKAIRKIHSEALKKAQAEYLRKASPK
jgi:hypothetical protein